MFAGSLRAPASRLTPADDLASTPGTSQVAGDRQARPCIPQSASEHTNHDTRVDERGLRDAFGRFATGVAFVTADDSGAPVGLIVSSFAAVSLEPPLVSFCPSRASFTWRRMREARQLAIYVLDARYGGFARRAADPDADRFAEPDVLHDALAVLECEPMAEHAAGDHTIVVAHVLEARVATTGQPLVYFAGAFGAFHPH